ncbi:MAG TPA: histidine kinase [Gaiellaceae bacterium]|nr:histidine kinase [Gaiellaceae bacterium]
MTAWPEALLREGRDRDGALLWAAGVLGAACSALALAVVLASDQPGERSIIGLASVLAVAVPVGVGIVVWRSGEYRRFGRLLVAWGLVDFLAVLSFSSDSALFSAGRIGIWIVEPVAVGVILSFPTGRLRGAADRALVGLLAALVLVLFLPTAFLVDRFPEPSFWTTCYGDCPNNAFQAVGTEPAFVEAWVRPVRELLLIVAYAGVVLVLAGRLQAATALGRRMLAPVFAVAIVRSVAIAAGVALRRRDPAAAALDPIAWIFVLCLPAFAAAFFVGIVRSRVLAGEALQRLAFRLGREARPDDVRDVLASTLGDPTLEVAYWIGEPGGWVDAAGQAAHVPEGRPDRAVTEVREDGRRVAALVHDPALLEQRRFVEAAGSFALAALENQRLRAQVESSLETLAESRARVQAAADGERRRIERDLHDGAQQRLVALRLRLERAAETVSEQPERGAAELRGLGREVGEAIEDVRSLARGIYPALLADRGLPDALRDAARRSPLPVAVAARGVGRYAPEVEAAVYFTCLEALQNAAKHARGATSVSVVLVDDGALRFEVQDDGSGFAGEAVAAEGGLANMRDRIEAVGGKLSIGPAASGTRVSGVIPLP